MGAGKDRAGICMIPYLAALVGFARGVLCIVLMAGREE